MGKSAIQQLMPPQGTPIGQIAPNPGQMVQPTTEKLGQGGYAPPPTPSSPGMYSMMPPLSLGAPPKYRSKREMRGDQVLMDLIEKGKVLT